MMEKVVYVDCTSLAGLHSDCRTRSDAGGKQDPPVRIWFNSGGDYAYGDRAKVYAKSPRMPT
jgi:hypothetical protein